MAFDIKKNARISPDGIVEVDSDSNETTLGMVEEASESNVLATQSWVSRMLKMFCCWTRLFHTDVLHATSEVVTSNVKSREAHLDEIYANSIVLTNEDGGMVRLKVGKDGKIDIEETLCDVFVYPGDCLVREYLYRSTDVVANFAGLTPYQTLLNFVPFIGWKSSEFNGRKCYILCTADGKDEFIGRTLLITTPPDKIVRQIHVLDANGDNLKTYTLHYEDNIQQLTINLPMFRERVTGEEFKVQLPDPSPIWTGRGSSVFPMPLPPPPTSCTGFVPDIAHGSMPEFPKSIGQDIYSDEVQIQGSEIDPDREYDVLQQEYSTDNYYNISLKRDFFVNNSKAQYMVFELQDRIDTGDTGTWSDETQGGEPAPVPETTYYTVTFVVDSTKANFTGNLQQRVAEGASATAPTVIAKTNWNFTGWDRDFSNITGNTTVTAQFTQVAQPEYFYWGYRLATDGEALDIDSLTSNDVLNGMHIHAGTQFPSTFSCEYPEGTRQIFLLAPHGKWNKRIAARDAGQGIYAFENGDLAYQNKVQVVGRDGATMVDYDLWCYLPRRAFTAPVTLTFTWSNI